MLTVSRSGGLPPVLLTAANYSGTLAAVRSLGRAGIRVTTADPARAAISAWSTYVSARHRCPPVRDGERFLEWLITFGRAHPKHVLIATSDDTAWLYARHRDRLREYFYIASPPIEVVHGLLNKATLYEHARAVGLRVPRTWLPRDVADLDGCRRDARFPVIVKPKTQVQFRTQSKGALVMSPDDLERRYTAVARQPYGTEILRLDDTIGAPMVQEFCPEAALGIYNISAYAYQGRVCGVRAARKLLQQPRRLGVGVCFEEAPILADRVAGLERLVARLPFNGVFEAEFIETASHAMLIDFNPRFYNQMAFDIARGLPLPVLAYLDALGEDAALEALLARAAVAPPLVGRVFVDCVSLWLLLLAQRLSGALTGAETKRWTEWYETHRHRCTFTYLDAADAWPLRLAVLQLALRHARHPRHFMRAIVFNQH